ncbi:MAG: helix-hairpin-helix domain-containing protein, partial [bacterium]
PDTERKTAQASGSSDTRSKQAQKQQKERKTESETEPKMKTSSDQRNGKSTSLQNKFNPNTVSVDRLKAIPGLPDHLADRIEWYRREVRPFKQRKDLRRVPGIDRSVFIKIKDNFHPGPY